MYRDDKIVVKKIPVGRYVILRAFKNKRLERHAEGDSRKYVELCAKALIAHSKQNKIEHVQVIDIGKGNSLVWEGRAS